MKSENTEKKDVRDRRFIQIRLRKEEYDRLEKDALRLGLKPSLLAYMAVKGLRIKDKVPESLIYKLSVIEEHMSSMNDIRDALRISDNTEAVSEVTSTMRSIQDTLLMIERMYIYPEGGRD